ncbi:bifunctional tetrahydrofolate synthase/dihydrofolate synthase [Ferrimonas senticii]|uniref:bifunctional tetrahydrofolate synthase/dihydrofolate synthase n=1 Tax=Ferrimonas senticii TaxID=394566 RepID=UPI0003F6A88E|nr:bifunctional tetrahydrofolate synthase/dihydrofolate synthase [Ferrimonas senticii]
MNRTTSVCLNASHSLEEWLDHILALHPSEIDLGLERLRTVASSMGLLSLPDSTVITVAGTNGKGTSCALLEQIYRNAGYSVGVFSSPHIERYNERVRLNGQELADAEHAAAFSAIAAAQADTTLTFFEYSALGALWLFAKHRPQVVILEVGLGGRLDATNLIDADAALITTIDLDHQDYLGDTRELVAVEKAGIMRAGQLAVSGDPYPPATLLSEAERIGAHFYGRNRDFSVSRSADDWGLSGFESLGSLPLPRIPLDNAAAVLTLVAKLPLAVTNDAIIDALKQVQVEGRLEFLSQQLVLDVAHNPQAGRYLADWLKQQPYRRVIAVCSMLGDKDMVNSVAPLLPLVDHWHTASLHVPRAASAAAMQQLLPQAQLHDSVADALACALSEVADGELVILFGSFYTVAQAKRYWAQRS